MKKLSYKSMIVGVVLVTTVLFGKIALAGSVGYNFRLPATGSTTTSKVLKETADSHLHNYVSYFGWEGSVIESWVYGCEEGKSSFGKISSRVSFQGEGDIHIWLYENLARTYKGGQTYLKLKTDSGTWHACDVRGEFDAR